MPGPLNEQRPHAGALIHRKPEPTAPPPDPSGQRLRHRTAAARDAAPRGRCWPSRSATYPRPTASTLGLLPEPTWDGVRRRSPC